MISYIIIKQVVKNGFNAKHVEESSQNGKNGFLLNGKDDNGISNGIVRNGKDGSHNGTDQHTKLKAN